MITDSLGLVALAMGAGAGRTPLSPAPATFTQFASAQNIRSKSAFSNLKTRGLRGHDQQWDVKNIY